MVKEIRGRSGAGSASAHGLVPQNLSPDKHVDVCVDSEEDRGSTPLASISDSNSQAQAALNSRATVLSLQIWLASWRHTLDLVQLIWTRHKLALRHGALDFNHSLQTRAGHLDSHGHNHKSPDDQGVPNCC